MIRCFECPAEAAHDHHVIPRSLGGKRVVPLCEKCHALAHGRIKRPHPFSSSELIRAGHARARARGVRFGRPITLSVHLPCVAELVKDGIGPTAVSRLLSLPYSSAQKLVGLVKEAQASHCEPELTYKELVVYAPQI